MAIYVRFANSVTLRYDLHTLGGVIRQALEGTLLVAYQSANTLIGESLS